VPLVAAAGILYAINFCIRVEASGGKRQHRLRAVGFANLGRMKMPSFLLLALRIETIKICRESARLAVGDENAKL
jgi:hypothetical protein